MKYVFNKGRYAQAFEIVVNGRERKVEFDRRRLFRDTGNVATTGITLVEDDVYDILLENKRFKALIDSGEFELTEETQLEASDKVNEALKAENEKLKKELKEAKKESKKESSDKEIKKQMKEKDDEISSLKAQLEALTAKKEEADTKDADTEGF